LGAAPAPSEAGAAEGARDFFIPAPLTGLGRFARWSQRENKGAPAMPVEQPAPPPWTTSAPSSSALLLQMR
jgi:hypothetical protein